MSDKSMGKQIVNKAVTSIGVFFILMGLVLTSADAQTLKQRKEIKLRQSSLQNEVNYTNKVCGTDIDADVYWSSYEQFMDSESAADLHSCDAVLSALESLCADKASQEVIKKKVDQVICTKGDSREVELKEGTLMFQVDGVTMDHFNFIREYLVNTLARD
jgi:hypothetical protein